MNPTVEIQTQKSNHLLIRAARGEKVERPPVWAMRQAGRWDPQFNTVRSGQEFYSFSQDIERSAQASLCPRRFGVDGIILFYDITTLPMSMGLPFELQPGTGPVPDRPIRTVNDLSRLNPEPLPDSYSHIRGLLKRVKQLLDGELPVIVFAGAAFTVATYCIGTGKNLKATRQFVAEKPEVWQGLLECLNHATARFLNQLIEDGADIYQLFDSWAGMLDETEYTQWAQPSHEVIFRNCQGVPRILFVKECPYLNLMTSSGADVVSLGIRHDLQSARQTYPHIVFQGNIDQQLLNSGLREKLQQNIRECLIAGGGDKHIINLNHGVSKTTPVENFELYIRTAKGES